MLGKLLLQGQPYWLFTYLSLLPRFGAQVGRYEGSRPLRLAAAPAPTAAIAAAIRWRGRQASSQRATAHVFQLIYVENSNREERHVLTETTRPTAMASSLPRNEAGGISRMSSVTT